jgi:hypothetical protein
MGNRAKFTFCMLWVIGRAIIQRDRTGQGGRLTGGRGRVVGKSSITVGILCENTKRIGGGSPVQGWDATGQLAIA